MRPTLPSQAGKQGCEVKVADNARESTLVLCGYNQGLFKSPVLLYLAAAEIRKKNP